MLEILIITVALIVIFAVVAWYAIWQSKQRDHAFLEQLNSEMEESTSESGNAFNAVFKQEMTQQSVDNSLSNIDDEPTVNLSKDAQQTVNQQAEMPLTVDDIQQTTEMSTEIVKDWDMMVAFTILAPEGTSFSGLDIKTVLENAGFHYGDMNIYHRLTVDRYNTPLFSVANLVEPGEFDLQQLATMTTPGILMFAKLPGPINGLTLFDELLETAQSLTDKLNGVLCDESQHLINQTILESMRSRILTMNLTLQEEENQYNNGYSD